MPRVIIADPDPISQNALILWLVYKLGIDDVVQVSDGVMLKKQLEEEIPDIILMDWSLPARPSLEYCQDIQQKKPDLKWIILSVDASVSKESMCCFPWFLQKGVSPDAVYSLLHKFIDR